MVKCESLRINMFRITHTGKFTDFNTPVVGRLLSAIVRNKIESNVLRYVVKNKKKRTQIQVTQRKLCIANHIMVNYLSV